MNAVPQVFRSSQGRIISFQLWTWRAGTVVYDLEHFQVHERADGAWATQRRTATYRAYTRASLTGLAAAADLRDITWHMPQETDFFQPILSASTAAHHPPPARHAGTRNPE